MFAVSSAFLSVTGYSAAAWRWWDEGEGVYVRVCTYLEAAAVHAVGAAMGCGCWNPGAGCCLILERVSRYGLF